MKPVLAVASAFALVMVAFGFMIATRQAIPTNLNRAQVANHFTDDRQDFSSEEASAGEQGTLGGYSARSQNLPPALRGHIEKLMRTVPNEGPAGSAADWRFMSRAYPASDISIDKTEGARAAHQQQLANFAAVSAQASAARGAAAIAPATWVSLGPTRAVYPLSPFRGYFNYVPNAYEAGGRTTVLGDLRPAYPEIAVCTRRRRAAACGARMTH